MFLSLIWLSIVCLWSKWLPGGLILLAIQLEPFNGLNNRANLSQVQVSKTSWFIGVSRSFSQVTLHKASVYCQEEFQILKKSYIIIFSTICVRAIFKSVLYLLTWFFWPKMYNSNTKFCLHNITPFAIDNKFLYTLFDLPLKPHFFKYPMPWHVLSLSVLTRCIYLYLKINNTKSLSALSPAVILRNFNMVLSSHKILLYDEFFSQMPFSSGEIKRIFIKPRTVSLVCTHWQQCVWVTGRDMAFVSVHGCLISLNELFIFLFVLPFFCFLLLLLLLPCRHCYYIKWFPLPWTTYCFKLPAFSGLLG